MGKRAIQECLIFLISWSDEINADDFKFYL